MALRNILNDRDPSLRKKSRPVTNFDAKLGVLLDDMAQTMYSAEGVGLAAPQVGILRRAVIIDVGEGLVELMNPEIVYTSREEEVSDEGCLSSPGEYGPVSRPFRVTVRAQNRHGEMVEYTGEGFFARAVCHEVDHLEGVLFKDLIIEGEKPVRVVPKKVAKKSVKKG